MRENINKVPQKHPLLVSKRGYQQGWQRHRFISSLLIASIVLVVGATAISSYGIVRNLLLRSLQENTLKEVQRASSDIDEWLAALRSQVETVANNSAVRSMDWSVAEPYLQLELDRLPDYSHFALSNPDGSFYTTTVGFAKGKNISDRHHFKLSMSGVTNVSDLVISKTTRRRQINISVPIWSVPPLNRRQLSAKRAQIRASSLSAFHLLTAPLQQAKPVGVLLGSVPVDHITEVVDAISKAQGGYAFALDSQGVAIAYPDRRILEEAKSFLDAPDPNLAAIARSMVNGKQGVELVQLEGEWVYVAYTFIERANWSLALVVKRDDLEKELGALNLLASVVGILLILATLITIRQLKLFEQTRERAAREALLNQLSSQIRASLDLKTTLQTTVDEVALLLELDLVAFSWYYKDRQRLETLCESRRENLPQQLTYFDISSFGDLNERLSRGEKVLFNDISRSSSLSQTVKQAYLQTGIFSYLALPILIEDNTLGYLICIRTTPKKWSESNIQLLSAAGDQLAIAINQSRLHAQTTEQVKIVTQQASQLSLALSELQKTQAQLIQTEKMSSLGQLVAGVAHEINNPVNFIYGNLAHVSQYTQDLLHLIHLLLQQDSSLTPEIQDKAEAIDLNFIMEDLPNMLSSMKLGAERIRGIVLSLRNFSRLDEAEMKPVDIHEGIDNSLLILQHRFKARVKRSEIKVIKEYGNLPLVSCYAGQLNQVFMNILSNAIDALEERWSIKNSSIENPEIRICTQLLQTNWVAISIADNGSGMTEKVRKQLFDPFFTTKSVGQGTGLGLSISYQIVVEKHGGVLKCSSEPGQGAEFWIEIPMSQSQAKVNKV